MLYNGVCGMIYKNIWRRFMIIYRPHRGSLSDALAKAKEFETEEEMK